MLLKRNAKLVLEDGSVFYGSSFGFSSSVSGEVVFSTGMVGYPESLTDPSFKGQILCTTYPLIGNYGVPSDKKDSYGLDEVFESESIQVQALIVSDYSEDYSHWNAAKSLGSWLKEQQIPGICGIDTRALTKKLREKGSMLGKIIIDEKEVKKYDPNQEDVVKKVTISFATVYDPSKKTITKIKNDFDIKKINQVKRKKIVLVDCGVKNNIIRNFLKREVIVIRVPYDYDFFKFEFDGLFISNGPGNPKTCKLAIENIKKAIKDTKPIFGICLGNQLLALASGANTYKLKYGHRSQNQPCIMEKTDRCFITTQNHGFAVNPKTLPKDWEVFFTNINDKTNEGIKHKTKPFFSCQFHPEAFPGPVDTEFLFDKFIEEFK
ncbi:glutamine-hydrolyzing carbamoyl-phosphate synthase small subunit [Candidatus Woesearchaeota archaeon]|nr:glutamine-hydrolyzing carbamoyl-phosphate synthase small subunit [Candidatus Woesearchaeota archaeon]